MSTFPYKREFITKETLLERFNRLKTFKPTYSYEQYTIFNMVKILNWYDKLYLPEQKPKVIAYESSNYHEIDEISDWFIEDVRIKAKRYDTNQSMLEFWDANYKTFPKGTPYDLREHVSSVFKEVGTFRPTNVVSMVREFNPRSILDFSSGWGDRLIAALACGVDYIGIDPNDALQKGYAEMIETFRSHSPNPELKVQMVPKRIEDFSPLDLDGSDAASAAAFGVDMIFTSPPYFDLEIYSDDPKQSHHYGDAWYEEFLLKALKKVWSYLKEGGHMIIIINDKSSKNLNYKDALEASYVKKMIRDVNLFSDSLFYGVISYGEKQAKGGVRSPQPMWIWKKKPLDFKLEIRDNILYDNIPDLRIRGYKCFNTKEDTLNSDRDEVLLAIVAKLNQKKAVYTGQVTKDALRAAMFGLTFGARVGYRVDFRTPMLKKYAAKNILDNFKAPKDLGLSAPKLVCDYFGVSEGKTGYIQMSLMEFINVE
jgi:tRNA1(Val) A37 N6-methylase TrmN6